MTMEASKISLALAFQPPFPQITGFTTAKPSLNAPLLLEFLLFSLSILLFLVFQSQAIHI